MAHAEECYVVSLSDGAYLEVPHAGVTLGEFTSDNRGLVTVGSDNVVRGWAWSASAVGTVSGNGWAPGVAVERFAVAQPRPIRSLLMLPGGRRVWVGDEDETRELFCDVFSDDDELLALARVAAGEPKRRGISIASLG